MSKRREQASRSERRKEKKARMSHEDTANAEDKQEPISDDLVSIIVRVHPRVDYSQDTQLKIAAAVSRTSDKLLAYCLRRLPQAVPLHEDKEELAFWFNNWIFSVDKELTIEAMGLRDGHVLHIVPVRKGMVARGFPRHWEYFHYIYTNSRSTEHCLMPWEELTHREKKAVRADPVSNADDISDDAQVMDGLWEKLQGLDLPGRVYCRKHDFGGIKPEYFVMHTAQDVD